MDVQKPKRKKFGGRQKGAKNKATKAKEMAIAKSGLTPLEFMLNVMRGTALPEKATAAEKIAARNMQFEAAKAAAPYVHPRMTANIDLPAPTAAQQAGMAAASGSEELGEKSAFEIARRIAFALNQAARAKVKAT